MAIAKKRLIEELGVKFVRLTSEEVENDLGGSLLKILRAVTTRSDSSHPCPASGAGDGG